MFIKDMISANWSLCVLCAIGFLFNGAPAESATPLHLRCKVSGDASAALFRRHVCDDIAAALRERGQPVASVSYGARRRPASSAWALFEIRALGQQSVRGAISWGRGATVMGVVDDLSAGIDDAPVNRQFVNMVARAFALQAPSAF